MTLDPKRIRLGLELIAQGGTFKFGSLVISASERGHITVTGFSNYRDITSLTMGIAEGELTSAKAEYKELIAESSDLAKFVQGKAITFRLGLDYGMGGFLICSETNGEITWDSRIPA